MEWLNKRIKYDFTKVRLLATKVSNFITSLWWRIQHQQVLTTRREARTGTWFIGQYQIKSGEKVSMAKSTMICCISWFLHNHKTKYFHLAFHAKTMIHSFVLTKNVKVGKYKKKCIKSFNDLQNVRNSRVSTAM